MQRATIKKLFNNSNDAIFLFDISGVVVFSNNMARTLPDITNDKVSRLIHPEVVHAANKMISENASDKEEIDLKRINGFFKDYKAHLYSVDGCLMALLVSIDIESRYHNMVDTFVQLINLEVAKPLHSLLLGIDLMHEMIDESNNSDKSDFKKAKEITLKNVGIASDRLKKVLEICELYGQDALVSNDRIHPIELMLEVIEQAKTLSTKKKQIIRLDCSDKESLGRFYGSHRWLARALCEFMISVIKTCQNDSDIVVSIRQASSFVLITIKNHGQLVPSKFKHSLYEAFKSTGRAAETRRMTADQHSKPMMELGLSIATRVINMHGGKIKPMQNGDEWDYCIEIPTGSTTAHENKIDTEQVMRYANDFSTLMKLVNLESIVLH